MSWLYGQTWLWYLIAFAAGVLIAWLLFVLPLRRRLRALQAGTAAPAAAAVAADVENSTETTAVIPPVVDEAVTEQFPAVDPALSTLDAQGVTGGVGGDTSAASNAFEATTELPVITPETTAVGDAEAAVAATVGAETVTAETVTAESTEEPSAPAPAGAAPAGETAAAETAAADATVAAAEPAAEPAAASAASDTAADADSGAAALGVAGLAGAAASTGKSTGKSTGASAEEGSATSAEKGAEKSADTAAAPEAESEPAATQPAHAPSTNGQAATMSADAEGPYGPGSALALADGSAPGPDYTIKGNAGSMLFHTTESPYYVRTKAEAWFRTAADAEAAGFTAWNKRRTSPLKSSTPKSSTPGIATQGIVTAPTVTAPTVTAPTFTPGPYPLSAKSNADGSAPTPEFTIKGNADSMLYHSTTSPYYGRTKAEAWFRTGADAEAAGFTAWRRK